MATRGEVNAKDLPSVNLNGVIDSTYSTLLVDNATNEGHKVSLMNFSDAVRSMVTSDVMASIGGEPKVATSISEMTDTDRIYVLTTDSNWYYYNGSAWTVGGTYGTVATDTTLTQPGRPANAKVVGDKINDLNWEFNQISNGDYSIKKEIDTGVWAVGSVSTSGIDPSATKEAHSGFFEIGNNDYIDVVL